MSGLEPGAVLAAWERGNGQDPVRRALTLLAVVGAGGGRAAPAPEDGDLDVGSRDVLLARVLAAMGGAVVWARADCGACAAALDVPVDVGAVARLPVHRGGSRFTTTVDGGEVAFRLPTTGDLLAVRGLTPQQAREALLVRCLLTDDPGWSGGDGGTTGQGVTGQGVTGRGGVDPATAEAVEAAMERIAPAGAVELLVECPCGTRTRTVLDIPVLLWAEIETRAAGLLRDVHALASAYGWAEEQVLALSPARRAAYLELAAP